MLISLEIWQNLLLSNRSLGRCFNNSYLKFTIRLSSLTLNHYKYNLYQRYVIRKILLLRVKEKYTWKRISDYLNNNRIRSVKGKLFSPQLVERIIFKYKRRLKNMKSYKKEMIDVRIENEQRYHEELSILTIIVVNNTMFIFIWVNTEQVGKYKWTCRKKKTEFFHHRMWVKVTNYSPD